LNSEHLLVSSPQSCGVRKVYKTVKLKGLAAYSFILMEEASLSVFRLKKKKFESESLKPISKN